MTCQNNFTLSNSLPLLFWFAICHLLFLSFSSLLSCHLPLAIPIFFSPLLLCVLFPPNTYPPRWYFI